MKTGDLEREFQIAAVETVYLAVLKECRYDEKVFLKMIAESGARNAAKSLLAHHVQSGLRGLRRLGRLDLTVEHLVIQPRWSDLFTNYEREEARERLKKRVRATKSAKRGHQCEAEDCPLRLGSAK